MVDHLVVAAATQKEVVLEIVKEHVVETDWMGWFDLLVEVVDLVVQLDSILVDQHIYLKGVHPGHMSLSKKIYLINFLSLKQKKIFF